MVLDTAIAAVTSANQCKSAEALLNEEVISSLKAALSVKSKTGEEALAGIELIKTTFNHLSMPALIIALAHEIIVLFEDKSGPKVQEAAVEFLLSVCRYCPDAYLQLLAQKLAKIGLDISGKPTRKAGTLKVLHHIIEEGGRAAAAVLGDIVSHVASVMNDMNQQVRDLSSSVIEAACKACGNRDLQPFIPHVISAMQDLDNVQKSVEKLSACVFVQIVTAPALAVMSPVLSRGLADKNTSIKRRSCMIIDNMCKLVNSPRDIQPIITGGVLNRVEQMVKNETDPDARSVSERALKTIQASSDAFTNMCKLEASPTDLVEKSMTDNKIALKPLPKVALIDVVTSLLRTEILNLSWASELDFAQAIDHWSQFSDIAENLVGGPCSDLVKALREAVEAQTAEVDDFVEDTEGEDLYKGQFSLAYGTLTILQETKLQLKKNAFYGLIGPQNCGKTTLMRAIANEQVEGFPKRDELKTIFVEHEIEEVAIPGTDLTSIDLTGVQWVMHTVLQYGGKTVDEALPVPTKIDYYGRILTLDDIEQELEKLGFGKDRAADPHAQACTYSGGWKMKMQLATAAILEADVLMLDEPTGHLDVHNIKWLEQWLLNFNGTILSTSYDVSFLDKTCTHVIDFVHRKLKTHRGTRGSCLSDFTKDHPEKASYFDLTSHRISFKFPEPGPLEGVKSKTKIILKMTNVTFGYVPGKTIVHNITLTCNMMSRVAVIGNNGAGKSTAIKLLVNELLPESGEIYRHPNMRIAYVAQHAFHHLEDHLEKTPVEYVLQRFAGDNDNESLDHRVKDILESEEKARAVPWCLDESTMKVRLADASNKRDMLKVVVPELCENRRKNKAKEYEYEVKIKGWDASKNIWILGDTLKRMGFTSLVNKEDERQAAMSGLMKRPLTQDGVETHFRDFALDAEIVSHTQINSLSGGQKVKVVIGAALWQSPHLIILDEPTNYLDRDGLGALITAIQNFDGGVVIISHNQEFASRVAQEKWIMEGGYLRREGESKGNGQELGGPDENLQGEILDAFGNPIVIKKEKTLDAKDLKSALRKLENKLRTGLKKATLTDDEKYELEDAIEEHKAKLATMKEGTA